MTDKEWAEFLASNIKSFLDSLRYMAPEMVEVQAEEKLAKPLFEYTKRND